ncbi:MAG: hypothetical protein EXR44_07940 [Dehalococcoidia bacterium]|nr:hypothetical protein [Dehalococcoidia bacterium]
MPAPTVESGLRSDRFTQASGIARCDTFHVCHARPAAVANGAARSRPVLHSGGCHVSDSVARAVRIACGDSLGFGHIGAPDTV